MTFPRLVWMVDNLLFYVYWLLDGVRSIKEVQKPFTPFWIYISIYLVNPIFSLFLIFTVIYVTNPIIDVCEVDDKRHYQCQSNV